MESHPHEVLPVIPLTRKPRKFQLILSVLSTNLRAVRQTQPQATANRGIGIKKKGSQKSIVIRLTQKQEIGFHFVALMLEVPLEPRDCLWPFGIDMWSNIWKPLSCL